MGTYVKGMETPKNCLACIGRGLCNAVKCDEWGGGKTRPENCPLVEVPEPHGILIDVNDCHVYRGDYSTYSDYSTAFDMIDNAPIVIEAEE